MGCHKSVLITGATGLLGNYIILRALKTYEKVVLLVRQKNGQTAKMRIAQVISANNYTWFSRSSNLQVVEGDICQRFFGLSSQEWEKLTNTISEVYHLAAFTEFNSRESQIAIATNVDGTQHVLEFVAQAGATFFAISTAYIAGEMTGTIPELPLDIVRWKNIYEETKYRAENQIHKYCEQHSVPYAVFRPAILCGDYRLGRTCQYKTIYSYLKSLHRLSQKMTKTDRTIRIAAKIESTVNLVPIDLAADALWSISQSKECLGNIYHITNPHPPTLRELAMYLGRIFDIDIHLVSEDSLPHYGKRLTRATSIRDYHDYLFGEPTFDLKNTSAIITDYISSFPYLDENYFRRIIDFAIADNWGEQSLTIGASNTAVSDTSNSLIPNHEKTKTGVPERKNDDYVIQYFEGFLQSKLNQQFVRNLKKLTATVAVRINDQVDATWVLRLDEGMLVSVGKKSCPTDCLYTLNAKIFETIARGNCKPQQAFFDGDVDIAGNMEIGLKVATALSEFFLTNPFLPDGQHNR